MVGSTRKRVMHIWHAVETCKAIQFYPLETMQVWDPCLTCQTARR